MPNNLPAGRQTTAKPEQEMLKELLYRCVKELDYVHSVENCDSGLCKSAEGESLIKEGMAALGVKDLSAETLEAS